MVIVSDESIDAAFAIFNKTSEEELQALFEKFSVEQPLIVGYIFAMSEELEVTEYRDILLQIGLIIWQSFIIEGKNIPEVTSDIIYAVETNKIDRLDGIIENDSESQKGDYIENSAQPVLIEFVGSQITDIENESVDESEQSLLFAILEVVVDSFDEVVNRRNLKIILN